MEKKQYTQEDLDRVLDELHKGPIGRRSEAQWASSVRLKEPKSEETKQKISLVHKGRKRTDYQKQRIKESIWKPIIATNIKTGESFNFPSQKIAADKLDMVPGNINAVLKGKFKQNKGYTFRYA